MSTAIAPKAATATIAKTMASNMICSVFIAGMGRTHLHSDIQT
ncbi:hypothetical protein [Paraburkholderia franconis]|nr:hypothetical protein [Paraburkholderia franconis]